MPFYKVYTDYALSENACDNILTNGIPSSVYAPAVRVYEVSRSPEQTAFTISAADEDTARGWLAAVGDAIGQVVSTDYTPPTPDPTPTPLNVWVRVGTWTKSIGGATTTISALPATPKGLILWGSGLSGAALGTFNEHGSVVVGFSDGTFHRDLAATSQDNVNPSNCNRAYGTRIFHCTDPTASGTSTVTETATATFGATSFDLNWSATTIATVGCYFVFGGNDIAEVIVKDYQTGTASMGEKEYTGLGNEFNFAFMLADFHSGDWTSAAVSGAAMHSISVHASTSNSKSWNAHLREDDDSTPSAADRRHNVDGGVLGVMGDGTSNEQQLAQWKGWTSDGFILNWTNAPNLSSFAFTGLFVRGGKWDAGTMASPAATGTTTNISESPTDSIQGMMAIATSMAPGVSYLPSSRFTIGAQDTNDNKACLSYGATTAVNPTVEATLMVSDKFLRQINPTATASSSTDHVVCTISDMDTAGQFSVNYTTVPGVANKQSWFSLSA